MKKQYAYFIIWNSSKNNFDNIIYDIKKNVNIKYKKLIEITNYKKLIYDIYGYNNQKELASYKADKMCNDNCYVIFLLKVEFLTCNLTDYSFVKKLKNEIRYKYKFLTENYFHDNIIHGTDSLEEYRYIDNLVLDSDKY